MRCTSPRTVGFQSDGKTICWSPKEYSKEYATFQLPCGKCIECRLAYAREWAIRCVHEAQMHENNSFITLTYAPEKLTSPKLQYEDFQLFMKKLRDKHTFNDKTKIGYFVTGEYGETTKRPHWHACVFNFRPNDLQYFRSNERGDKIYTSQTLTDTWSHGHVEIGQITLESAGYCARYAAKKLVHGKDQDHEYHPISKKSSKNAIGKRFVETYWSDIFNSGFVITPQGDKLPIPRYYEKWLQKHRPEDYERYVFNVKTKKQQLGYERGQREAEDYKVQNEKRCFFTKGPVTTRIQSRKKIQNQKFKQLQEKLKL